MEWRWKWRTLRNCPKDKIWGLGHSWVYECGRGLLHPSLWPKARGGMEGRKGQAQCL